MLTAGSGVRRVLGLAMALGTGFAAAQLQMPEIGEPIDLGDQTPKLEAIEWVRGEAIDAYETGEIYVLDFWAMWCAPCIAMMPHLTELQEQYEDDGVTIVGVNIDRDERTLQVPPVLLEKVRTFVDENEERIGFDVMIDKGASTDARIRMAAGVNSIPSSFIVDRKGRLAWIGNPANPEFDRVLAELVAGEYDVDRIIEARALSSEAVAAFRAGDRAIAFEKIDRILELNPRGHARLVVDRLQLTAMDGDGSVTRAYATRVIDALDEDSASLGRIAAVLNAYGGDESADEAARAGSLAVELTRGESPGILVIHAETFARQGDFARGIELLERALGVLGSDTRLKSEIDTRLENYRAGKVS